MSTSKLIHWSGLAAILGGVLLIPGSISLEPPWSWLGILGSLLLIFGFMGIYAVQVEGSGLAGFLGFVLAVPGAVLLVGTGEIGGIEFWMLGSFLGAAGFLLLAIGTLASGKFPHWVPWAWIAAIVVGLPSIFVPSLAQTLGIAGSVLAALGMIGAGYTLWSRQG